MKLLVVSGSRDLKGDDDSARLFRELHRIAATWKGASDPMVMHGCCGVSAGDLEDPREASMVFGRLKGADHFAHLWAAQCGFQVLPMPARWLDGKMAGPRRNGHMVSIAAHLKIAGWSVRAAAFPIGRSPGTRGFVKQWQKSLGADSLEVFDD